MPVSGNTVNIAATATLIATGDQSGKQVVVARPAATIYLGGPGVTTTDGFAIGATDQVYLVLKAGDVLYAIAAAPTTASVIITRN